MLYVTFFPIEVGETSTGYQRKQWGYLENSSWKRGFILGNKNNIENFQFLGTS